MRLIPLQGEVLIAEGENIRHRRIEPHVRERERLAAELFARLFEMVQIKMRIAQSMDELARLEPADLRHHQGQERIRRDVEGYAQKNIGRALVELAAQFSVGDIKLKQAVTGRQGHF